ncbi:DUF402 domain-containing protein [Rhodococcus sp. ABRD24]|uniref:DUF402 domain-containing protein n=1 Tax=Rhodococcus sp. ABRD24 TaxID=2507582 RepID=UPI0010396865|nr:DUF402 domain-containing protein [Rhodococcus sp. ABRD24]QBJ94734.1 DUF402 domain-containing protein [Rhodococcus sp. ABRD24]
MENVEPGAVEPVPHTRPAYAPTLGLAPAHRPKTEFFNISERTNTDPKGFVRPVDHFRVEPWGLYMARTADHPQFHYLESWLLPDLGIRASIFHFHPYHERDQDHYIDIGDFTRGADVWKSEDHYLDLVVRTGRDTELLDVDELISAAAHGLISAAAADRAVHCAMAAVDGIAAHGHDMDAWLASKGMPVTWR